MAWTSKGADRGRQYQVYKDLEREFTGVKAYNDFLLVQLKRKDELIRSLSAELASQSAMPIAGATTDVDSVSESKPTTDTMPVTTGLSDRPAPSSVAESLADLYRKGVESSKVEIRAKALPKRRKAS